MNRKTILGDPPPIRITERDLRNIGALVDDIFSRPAAGELEALWEEIERAELVKDPESAPPFVKIGTHVVFRDETGKVRSGTLVLPGEPWRRGQSISILAPVGVALLGLSVGQSISYMAPGGRTKTITVLKI
ncbi:MAG TPA: GreA/GreB family elongation factor [Alphaproteobacteria bacterium]|nr:GreA/GreB family elongation factor [Alphaproteobacteria bacterium]